MDKRTRSALEESIVHWEELAGLPFGQVHTIRANGSACALCQEFYEKNNVCDGCPVAERTGQGGCEGSPWHSAYSAKFSADEDGLKYDRWKKLAKEELEFLLSLRETELGAAQEGTGE